MAIPPTASLILPRNLPAASAVTATDMIVGDNGSVVQRVTPPQIVDAAIPLASQTEAEAGTDNTKRMTPLRVAQAISFQAVSAATLASDTGATLVGAVGGLTVQAEIDNLKQADSDLQDGVDIAISNASTALNTANAAASAVGSVTGIANAALAAVEALADPGGADSVGYNTNLTVEKKLLQRVCILDYCTPAEQADILSNTGSLDVSAAWQAAFDDLSPNGVLNTGGGTHRLSSAVTVSNKTRIRLIGEGARILENSPATPILLSFTTCNYLSVSDMHFVGTETQAYWAANSPTTRRVFIQVLTSSNVRIKDVTGQDKRGHIRLDDCTRSIVEGIDFEGFLPADATTITNANFVTAVNISGGQHNKLINSHAEKMGSVCTWGLDGVGHTVSGCTGRYLHDNGIYGSSGTRCRAFGNDFSEVSGSGVKLRGSLNIAFGNTGLDVGTIVTLSGNGTTPDSFGANGYGNIACLNSGATARNNGISLDEQDGYHARDTVVAFNAIVGAPGTLGNGGIAGAVKRGLVIAGNVLSEVSGDYGILAAGTASLQIQSSCFMGNVITSFTGGQQPIRANYMKDAAFIGNVTGDSATLIQTRQSADVSFVGNVNSGGTAVSATAANTNTGVVATGQRGQSNVPNSGSVTGTNNPEATTQVISSTPAALGLITVSSGLAYISTGTTSASDWKLAT